MAAYRRMYLHQLAVAAEHRGAREELQAALRRSETERADLQASLLRVGFGYAPFVEPSAQQQQAAQPEQPAPDRLAITAGMSDKDVQALFTREAMELYGGNMRQIKHHVEMRQAEHYAHRSRQPILTQEEKDQAAKVAADIAAAIEEGRLAAQGEA